MKAEMIRVSRCVLAACLSGALVGCANQQQLAGDGPISLSQTMMDQAAAMGSAPNFNEGLTRMNAIMQRDQQINAQAAYQQ